MTTAQAKLSFVEGEFRRWCRMLGYGGQLLCHGSSAYDMALDTSDVDIIFDTRKDLIRIKEMSCGNQNWRGQFKLVTDPMWYFSKRSCRVQFAYQTGSARGVMVDACARDKGTAVEKVAHMQQKFNDDLNHALGLQVKRWWRKCAYDLASSFFCLGLTEW